MTLKTQISQCMSASTWITLLGDACVDNTASGNAKTNTYTYISSTKATLMECFHWKSFFCYNLLFSFPSKCAIRRLSILFICLPFFSCLVIFWRLHVPKTCIVSFKDNQRETPFYRQETDELLMPKAIPKPDKYLNSYSHPRKSVLGACSRISPWKDTGPT